MRSPFSWRARLGSLSTTSLVTVISFFGMLYFFVPVMTPYLQAKGLSLVQIAGMQTVLMISQLVMEIPTGVLADRMGHRRSYQLSMVMAALGEVITLMANTYPEFLFGQFVAGTGFALASGSLDALLYESLPRNTDRTSGMQKAKGQIGAAMKAASLVAFAVGGWLTRDLTFANMRLTLKLDVIFVGFAAVLVWVLREPAREIVAERLRSLDLLKAGWNTVRSSGQLKRLILFAIVTNPFVPHLLIFYQAYFLQSEVAPVWLGMALALGSALAFFTQLHAWRLSAWLGDRRALVVATIIPGFFYLAMALVKAPLWAVVIFVVQWSLVEITVPLFSGLYNERIPDTARATTLSLITIIVTIYISLGGIVLGWLAGISLSMMFAILGGVIIVGALFVRPLEGLNPES